MLVPFSVLMGEAEASGRACAAFTCYDLETAGAVLGTAARRNRAVVVLVSPASVRGDAGDAFLAALLAYADRFPARSCIQVDHLHDLEQIARVLELGAGAVLADGSHLPLEENVAFVRAAAEMAARTGAAVEAELGRVEGDEDLATAARTGRLTDPDEAARFVAETSANCLAVSVGNSHGRYPSPPTLDWERLQAIRRQVDVPLALHGASGIPADSVRRAVALGVRKVNVNTELREAYLRATADSLEAVCETAAAVDLHRAQERAVAEVVAAKLDLYERRGTEPLVDDPNRHPEQQWSRTVTDQIRP